MTEHTNGKTSAQGHDPGAEVVRIEYCGDIGYMSWNGAEASATIFCSPDGEEWYPTQYQTADACHRIEEAVRLVAALLWGYMYETWEDAEAEGHEKGTSAITVWEDVEYEIYPEEDTEEDTKED